MDAKRLTGVNAGSLKYDLLTALSSVGLHTDQRLQLTVSRLILLITARYNWRLDEFSVGQRDLARMWGVTERTVKREVKFWQEQRIVICKRQGVRGRVAAYRLNYPEIYRLSQPFWQFVGPDFVERMQLSNPVQSAKIVNLEFPHSATGHMTGRQEAVDPKIGGWRDVCKRLRDLHPSQYQSWIAQLSFESDVSGVVRLSAPSRFAAQYIQTHLMVLLLEAVEAELGPRNRIEVQAKS